MGRRFRLIAWSAAIIGVAIVVLIVGQEGYVGEVISRLGETGSPVAVHDISSIDTLRQAFNADAGTPRLILLVSPT